MLSTAYSDLPPHAPRPPTPPQDLEQDIEDTLQFLTSDIELEKAPQLLLPPQQISSDTPPSSSPFRQITIDNVNATKKVGFLSTPTYHPQADIVPGSSPKSSPARSRLLAPPKSILKLGTFSPLPTPEESEPQCYFSSDVPQSFGKMLDSVTKQLESSSSFPRLDAYLMINGALMSYEDLPDHEEMIGRMDHFQRFILRDTALRELDGGADMQIAVQALKLAARIFADDIFMPATTPDFHASMLDRSIAILEHANRPKMLLKMSLGLLAQQQFSSAVLTAARVERLVTALQDIDERCPGNSVIGTRLLIYQRLIRQAQSTMSARMHDWLQHVLHGMTSDHPETRQRSIELCLHASGAYGGNVNTTKVLHSLLDTEVSESSEEIKTFFDHFTKRVVELLQSGSSRLIVPQIWSGIVLFHRSTRLPIYKWKSFKRWLLIMQSCLVASDSELRCQAHSAWRKLIYVVHPSGSIPPWLVSLLMKPMHAGFARSGNDKRSRELRSLALEGYYNLLHYALRPCQTLESLDLAWKHYVVDTVSTMASASPKGGYIVCRILQGLLTPNTGAWNPGAALEEAAIQPDDLPRLDVRWTRSRLACLLALVEIILPQALNNERHPEYVDAAADLLTAIVQSIVEAGAQEIRSSAESKNAIIGVLNLFQRMLTQHKEDTVLYSKMWQQQRTMLLQFGPQVLLNPFIGILSELETAQLLSAEEAKHYKPISPLLYTASYCPSDRLSECARLIEDICMTTATVAAKTQLLSDICESFDGTQSSCMSLEGVGLSTIIIAMASILDKDTLMNEQDSNAWFTLCTSVFRRSQAICGRPKLYQGVERSGDDTMAFSSLWSTLLRTLQVAHSAGNIAVQSMEEWLMLGLTSTMKSVVEMTLRYWNDELGHAESWSISLREAIATANVEASSEGGEAQPIVNATDEANKEMIAVPKPTIRKLFKEARPHHNDSQANFAVIEQLFTPVAEESQHLTSHQKEVHQRQRIDTAAYPELSSSPVPVLFRNHITASDQLEVGQLPATPVVMEPEVSSATKDNDPDDVDTEDSPSVLQSSKAKRVRPLRTPRSSQVSSPLKTVSHDLPSTVVTPMKSGNDAAPQTPVHADGPLDEQDMGESTVIDSPTAQLQYEIAASFEANSQESASDEAEGVTNAPQTVSPAVRRTRSQSRKRKRGEQPEVVDREPAAKRRLSANKIVTNDTPIVDDDDIIVVSSNRRVTSSQASLSSQSQQLSSQQGAIGLSKRARRRSRRRQARLSAESTPIKAETDENEQQQQQDGAASEPADETSVIEATHTQVPAEQPEETTTATDVMSRLRQALVDCQGLTFDAREEREIDDLLFELRQANHEAGRRGRDTT